MHHFRLWCNDSVVEMIWKAHIACSLAATRKSGVLE